MRTLVLSFAVAALLAGCVTPAAPATPAANEGSAEAAAVEPTLIKWKGHIVEGAFDLMGHDQPTEAIIWPAQQAGYNLEVTEVPQAIEVRVDWTGGVGAGFALHPHWLIGDDASGKTQYWGYHSPTYTTSPGCIRIPVEDMRTGLWPMMVHPSMQTVNTDFTITVGLLGGAAKIMPELHGHRADGNYEIAAHHVGECEFLTK